MPFSYYDRLSPREKAVYRESDGISWITLPRAEALRPVVDALEAALATDARPAVEAACARLCDGVCERLKVPLVTVRVLAIRPTLSSSELHGLYTHDGRRPPRIQVWMRTARHRRVVAFRTFLRTLLHEIGHHLDYTYLRLAESYHTDGFFKRESSLFRQVVG